MNEQHSESTATPVAGTERIASLDVLRGVAILGILVMNIYAFAMPFPAYNNPLLMGGSDTLNIGTWFFTHILFDQKFMSIFAMLFGAGIILMTGRAEAKGAKYGRIFYRRQLWLVVLGALHAYLFWFGDILFLYAVVGMLAYLFRNRRPRTLIVIACVLLPVVVLMSYGTGFSMQKLQSKAAQVHVLVEAGDEVSEEQQAVLDKWDEQRPMMAPDAETIQQDVVTHLGSYFDIAAERIPLAMVAFFGWRVLALMLLGMALMKTGVLSAQRTSSFYRNMMLICYGLGLPLTIYSAVDLYAHEFVALYVFKVGGIANYFGSILVGLGHIALLMLLLRGGYVQQLLQRFAAVGRMALSNYLMHSVLLTTVFYGYGLGLYGSVSRFGQMGFVLGVIALQLVLSPWWLARYRFGPVEWLWRSLTYWKRQPMLR